MRRTRSVGAAVAALLVASAGTAGAQIVNGSFEEPVISSTFNQISSGLTGWTIQSGGSVDLIRSYWQAADGAQSLDLSGGSAGTIYQDFTLSQSGSYNLFFAMAGNPDGGDAEKSMMVSFGPTGGAMQTQTFSFIMSGQNKANMGWLTQTMALTVDAPGSYRVQFQSLETNAFGAALDNVSLSAVSTVPEPGTIILLGTGILALGGFGLRRRAKS